jgi:hypothetical protein
MEWGTEFGIFTESDREGHRFIFTRLRVRSAVIRPAPSA